MNKKNNPLPQNSHSIMFHHFHDDSHPQGQGSLSETRFEEVLDFLDKKYSLISAQEYTERLVGNNLEKSDICLSFDDALLCQYEIACPIMKKRNIHAFFFVYSSPFMGNPDYLEIYRYFRTTCFKNIDDFYNIFFQEMKNHFPTEYLNSERKYNANSYLKDFPFYSPADKWFRYMRDRGLGKQKYEKLMQSLIRKCGFDEKQAMKNLWMNNDHLVELKSRGHMIGLHSYTHPTTLHMLDKTTQAIEYTKNLNHLSDVLGENPIAMSHPCGNYNEDTLNILRGLGIQIGFRSNMSIKSINSNLEVPREDHANVLREINS